MDEMPNGGKVVIVDDRFQEILPLINILNKNAIPIIYYSGKVDELPVEPLQGIRVFFLDLRFSTNTDVKTIVSNACNILERILGEHNGPYLLMVWSSTGNEYKQELDDALKDKKYRPEFILCLSKADYFEAQITNVHTLLNDIKQTLIDDEVDNVEDIMEKINLKVIMQEDEEKKVFITENIGKLQEELYNGLKEARLLYLFMLWENTVRNSVHKVVNEIYAQIPTTIPIDKKLPAMAFYLSKNRLEKQFDCLENMDKLYATLLELNELYGYFYSEDVIKINVSDFTSLSIYKIADFIPSGAKFNSWKMIVNNCKPYMPGSINEDVHKIFRFFKLIKSYTDANAYNENEKIIQSDKRVLYVLANINGECEIAQDKYPVVRVIPGILIPCNVYNEYESKGILKNLESANDYIFNEFDKIEYNGIEYYLLFNINQCTFLYREKLNDLNVYFGIHRKYYLKLREYVSSDLSKQGIDLYHCK